MTELRRTTRQILDQSQFNAADFTHKVLSREFTGRRNILNHGKVMEMQLQHGGAEDRSYAEFKITEEKI